MDPALRKYSPGDQAKQENRTEQMKISGKVSTHFSIKNVEEKFLQKEMMLRFSLVLKLF